MEKPFSIWSNAGTNSAVKDFISQFCKTLAKDLTAKKTSQTKNDLSIRDPPTLYYHAMQHLIS